MRLTIIGATGGTGKLLVDRALDHSHTVSVVARRPSAVPPRDGLTVHKGDLYDEASLVPALQGSDVAIMTAGVSGLLQARKGTDLYSTAGRTLPSAMRRAGVRRGLFVSSGGVVPQPGDPWFYRRILKPWFLEKMYVDMRVMESLVLASELDWVVVRPPYLVAGPVNERYRLSGDGLYERDANLTRASLAHYLLDEAERPRFTRRIVAISD